MTLNIQVLSWNRYDNVAGLNILMGPPLFDNWISNSNTDTIEMIKILHRFFSTQKDHILSQDDSIRHG
jgi:hypothetical protein